MIATANGLATHVETVCRLAAVRELEAAQTGVVLLDSLGRILAEYLRVARPNNRPPNVGDAFVRWLFTVQGDRRYCRKIRITERGPDDFSEYPNDSAFRNFDLDDRKFVAVAIASGTRPTIVNATDSDWATISRALARYGITLVLLCPTTARLAGSR